MGLTWFLQDLNIVGNMQPQLTHINTLLIFKYLKKVQPHFNFHALSFTPKKLDICSLPAFETIIFLNILMLEVVSALRPNIPHRKQPSPSAAVATKQQECQVIRKLRTTLKSSTDRNTLK